MKFHKFTAFGRILIALEQALFIHVAQTFVDKVAVDTGHHNGNQEDVLLVVEFHLGVLHFLHQHVFRLFDGALGMQKCHPHLEDPSRHIVRKKTKKNKKKKQKNHQLPTQQIK
jgi:hypothetical protein